jgi:hypothetical protein
MKHNYRQTHGLNDIRKICGMMGDADSVVSVSYIRPG